ncbi:FAD-binding protein, partial [Chloroflexota bacterium]
RAAIEAYEAGAKTTLAVKGRFGWRGLRGSGATSYSTNEFGYLPSPRVPVANLDEEREVVYKRIIQCGLGLTDRRLARVMVEDGLEARKKLEEWGVILPRLGRHGVINGRVDPRIGLANVVRGSTNITVLEQTMVTDLLIQDGICVGAIAINEDDGEPLVLKTGATILATGGQAQLYRFNRHPSCVTGDGYAMGYNAGAELMNMEFIYTNIGTAYPNCFNVYCGAWREHPSVRNVNGEEFRERDTKPTKDRIITNASIITILVRFMPIVVLAITHI